MADLRRAYEEVRSLPDEALGKELSSPTGAIPGYLIMAELDERKALRGGGGNPNPMSMKDELLMGGTIPQPTTQDAMGPSRQYSRGGIISGLNPFNTMMQGMKNPEISGGLLQEQINAAAGGLPGLMSAQGAGPAAPPKYLSDLVPGAPEEPKRLAGGGLISLR